LLRRCSLCCLRTPTTRGLPELSGADAYGCQRHRQHRLEVAVSFRSRRSCRDWLLLLLLLDCNCWLPTSLRLLFLP
jgi:hypothetical protein